MRSLPGAAIPSGHDVESVVDALVLDAVLPRDLTERAAALVRALDLEGYSEVEFRYDSAGVPRV